MNAHTSHITFFVSFTLIAIILFSGCQGQKENQELANPDYASYCGKEVGALIDLISRDDTSDYTWSSEPPGVFHSVFLKGDEGKVFEIFVEELTFQGAFSPEIRWSFELFQKETFRGIIIWDGREKAFQYFCPKSSS
ncbi:MAG: hypothetical protein AAFQ83_22855 [Bacteroidota bacterium]